MKKSYKRVLLLSVLTMLMCAALIAGATMAWFTSKATGHFKVQAGGLKIGLEKWDGQEYVDISDSQTPVFDEDVLWEPGYTALAAIKIVNKDNLALKYKVVVDSKTEGEELEASLKLAEVIEAYYLDNADNTQLPANREDLSGFEYVGTLKDLLTNGMAGVTGGYLTEEGAADYAIIALHMQESAGNEYKKLAGHYDITLYATQYSYESDAFGPDYDEDVAFATTFVEASEDAAANGVALQEALVNAVAGEKLVLSEGTYALPAAQTVEGQTGAWLFAITEDNVTISGNGAVIVPEKDMVNGGWSDQNIITVFGNNVTIEDVTVMCKGNTNKAIEVRGMNSTIKNVNVVCEEGKSAGGSIYYVGEIGDAKLINVTVEKKWISATAANGVTGTLTMENVTVDYVGCSYADMAGYYPLNVIKEIATCTNVTVYVDSNFNAEGYEAMLPAGVTLIVK